MILPPGDEQFMAPAWSRYSKHVVASDHRKKDSTAYYRRLVFYNDRRVQAPLTGKADPRLKPPTNDAPGQIGWEEFDLPDVLFLCPACGEMSMRFSDTNLLWD